MNKRFFLALSLFTLSLTVVSPAKSEEQHCRYIGMKTIPITVMGMRPVVEGSINGQPMKMLLDTGAYATFLYPSAVKKTNIRLLQTEDLSYGVGGIAHEYNGWVEDITVGPLHAKHVEMGVLRTVPGGDSIDVALGVGFLFNYDLEMSFAEKYIKFFSPQKCGSDDFLAYWDNNADAVPLKDVAEGDDRKSVIVEINGHPVHALIDSGASHSLIYANIAQKVGMKTKPASEDDAVTLHGIGKGTVDSGAVDFDTFQIGGELIKNGKILVAGERCRSCDEMILGADFLRAHRILFAVSQKRMYFSYVGGPVFITD